MGGPFMGSLTIYTMQQCPYCEAAKGLLKSRDIAFEEIKLSQSDDAAWESLYRRSRMKTVPQIFAGERLIGGFSDLAALDKEDGLRSLKVIQGQEHPDKG
jgi:glutaredoxin 3